MGKIRFVTIFKLFCTRQKGTDSIFPKKQREEERLQVGTQMKQVVRKPNTFLNCRGSDCTLLYHPSP